MYKALKGLDTAYNSIPVHPTGNYTKVYYDLQNDTVHSNTDVSIEHEKCIEINVDELFIGVYESRYDQGQYLTEEDLRLQIIKLLERYDKLLLCRKCAFTRGQIMKDTDHTEDWEDLGAIPEEGVLSQEEIQALLLADEDKDEPESGDMS